MPKDFAAARVLPHHHERAQLIHATAGTMRVSTDDGVWVVPPQRAVWMPGGIDHAIVMLSDTTMRTLMYVRCRSLHAAACRSCRSRIAARADCAGDGIAVGLR